MARTVADIAFFNGIFSNCNTTLVNVSLAGYRIGYPTNWWSNLGTEVCPIDLQPLPSRWLAHSSPGSNFPLMCAECYELLLLTDPRGGKVAG